MLPETEIAKKATESFGALVDRAARRGIEIKAAHTADVVIALLELLAGRRERAAMASEDAYQTEVQAQLVAVQALVVILEGAERHRRGPA